eukprot:scaffold114780_cov48-Phaeocystis_antarctica.AAC.2
MVKKNKQCATWTQLAESKANKKCLSSGWSENKYCEQSCFDVGHAYSDCCRAPPPSTPPSHPPPTPSLPPPSPSPPP